MRYFLLLVFIILFSCDRNTTTQKLSPEEQAMKDRALTLFATVKTNITLERIPIDLDSLDAEWFKIPEDSIHQKLSFAENAEGEYGEKKNAIAKQEEKLIKQQLKESLERESKSIKKGIDFSKYRGSVDNLKLELAIFAVWARLINQAEHSEDAATKKLGKQLKSRVVRIQKKEFPLLRKEYGKVVGEKMWEQDIDVYTSGSKKDRLNLTGGLFAANKNIKDFQEVLYPALQEFRFQQSRYRWYKGQDEYQYYKIEVAKDSELYNVD